MLKDGPIKTLADLKGKKVGYSVASLQDAYIGAILGSAGLTAKDVEMVNVNFNLTTSLMSGQVDAVIDGYRNFELTQLAIEGKPGIAFFPEEHGVPPYDELIYVTRKELARGSAHGALHRGGRGGDDLPDQPSGRSAGDVPEGHPDLDDKLNRKAFADTLPRFAKRPAALDPGRYDRFAAFLKDERPARHDPAGRQLRDRAALSAVSAFRKAGEAQAFHDSARGPCRRDCGPRRGLRRASCRGCSRSSRCDGDRASVRSPPSAAEVASRRLAQIMPGRASSAWRAYCVPPPR